jgi:hypothetical protein
VRSPPDQRLAAASFPLVTVPSPTAHRPPPPSGVSTR